MAEFYEKPMWTSDAQGFRSSASLFATMATILGVIGIIIALIMGLIGLFDLGGAGKALLLSAVVLGFQSVMLVVFGSMMRGLADVLLAVFEMNVQQTRHHIHQDGQADEGGQA